jgi:hypothetical protein
MLVELSIVPLGHGSTALTLIPGYDNSDAWRTPE